MKKQFQPPRSKSISLTNSFELRFTRRFRRGTHAVGRLFRQRSISRVAVFFTCATRRKQTGAKKIALGTQFEPTDARRMFPCWDEPSFRARFQLTAVVPENWLAVSNMPVESENEN